MTIISFNFFWCVKVNKSLSGSFTMSCMSKVFFFHSFDWRGAKKKRWLIKEKTEPIKTLHEFTSLWNQKKKKEIQNKNKISWPILKKSELSSSLDTYVEPFTPHDTQLSVK